MENIFREKVEKEIGCKLTNIQWCEAVARVADLLEKKGKMTEDQKFMLYCIKCMDILGI